MLQCKIINFSFSVFPLNSWRDFLIRQHVSKCPNCQRRLVSKDEVKPLFLKGKDSGDVGSIWPGVREKVEA